jgi:argininosuccinate lyase
MANKMLWGGRFSQEPDVAVLAFNSEESVKLDGRLARYDVLGSMAHTLMLQKQGILKGEEAGAVLVGLLEIFAQVEQGKFKLKPELEDVHMNVEAELSRKYPAAKKMHTARSRNDQVTLDTRMYMRDAMIECARGIIGVRKALATLSSDKTPFPTYTHTRVAQPATVSFWANAWFESFGRDLERLLAMKKRLWENPLGAGAVAGTTWNIDRKYTTKLLGFDSVQENALDVVSSRGEHEAELVSVLAIAMVKASRIAEELIWLSEKGIVEIPDRYCSGSSIMPQKKNADCLELVRGRAARVQGHLVHLLALSKGLPSGYNSDSQESKFALMGAIDVSLPSMKLLAGVLAGISVDREKAVLEIEEGYACATELADLLARKGVPFRDAHSISGQTVAKLIKEKRFLSSLKVFELPAKGILQHELAQAVNPDKGKRMVKAISAAEAGEYESEVDSLERALAKSEGELLALAKKNSK